MGSTENKGNFVGSESPECGDNEANKLGNFLPILPGSISKGGAEVIQVNSLNQIVNLLDGLAPTERVAVSRDPEKKSFQLAQFGKHHITPSLTIEGRHPLLRFVREELIPPHLDVLLLEDMGNFHSGLSGDFEVLTECRGLFLAPNHCWAAKSFVIANQALKERYGVEMHGPTLLLPQKNMRVGSLIHEGLHAVFHLLPENKRQELVEAALHSYATTDDLRNMLELTHLNSSQLDWSKIMDKVKKIMAKSGPESTQYGHLYTLANTTIEDCYMVIDEFIANFYANNRGYNRWDRQYLPQAFKSKLEDLGYNMTNPPEVPRA